MRFISFHFWRSYYWIPVIVLLSGILMVVFGCYSAKQWHQSAWHTQEKLVTSLINQSIQPHSDEQFTAPPWLPMVLQAQGIERWSITLNGIALTASLLHSEVSPSLNTNVSNTSNSEVKTFSDLHLSSFPDYRLSLTMRLLSDSVAFPWWLVSTGFMIVTLLGICLGYWGYYFRSNALNPLFSRGSGILQGDFRLSSRDEQNSRVNSTHLVLDHLIQELNDSRQERCRFDAFMRRHTFLDPLTGCGNRIWFDSRLRGFLQDQEVFGAVLWLSLSDWEEEKQHLLPHEADDFILAISRVLTHQSQAYRDPVLSRYSDGDFILMLPHKDHQDIKLFATHLFRHLEHFSADLRGNPHNWCHMGVSYFHSGERRSVIMSEAEDALRSARLQDSNGWSVFQKDPLEELHRGNVRWRSLFDRAFNKSLLVLFQQPVMARDSDDILHRELFVRVYDEKNQLIKASRFLSALEQIGYWSALDRHVITQGLQLVKTLPLSERLSINVAVDSLLQVAFFEWLKSQLLELSSVDRGRLAFEVTESRLIQHWESLSPHLIELKKMGVKLTVDQAGRTIVSTHYIKSLGIDCLKLHRGLIRGIDQRFENQWFVRSMMGAAENSRTLIIAVGVETEAEWITLQKLGIDAGQGRYFFPETALPLNAGNIMKHYLA